MNKQSANAFAGASTLLDPGVIDQMRLAWRLLRDERVSSFKFVIPALIALYVASPIDPIPDFLLGLGQVDDLGVIMLGLLIAIRAIPKLAPTHIVDEHLQQMGRAQQATASNFGQQEEVVDARYNVR